MDVKDEVRRLEKAYNCSIRVWKLGKKYGATATFSDSLKQVGTIWHDTEEAAIVQIGEIASKGPPTM